MIVFPQLVLDDVLRKFLDIIRTDLQKPKDENILGRLFGSTARFRRDYYKEAADLFARTKESSRFIDVRLMFDRERAKVPTVHLTVPSDSEESAGIGNHQGYIDPVETLDGRATQSQYTRFFKGRFNIVFTSDNERECIVMYEVFRAMLLSASAHLEFMGLKNVNFGGQDLSVHPELIPPHIYMKMLTITTVYEVNVGSLQLDAIIGKIFININSQTDAC